MDELYSLLGKRLGPVAPPASATIVVEGDPHGIRNCWFNWPWNFDPTWLVSCDGFKEKEGANG